MTHALIAIVSVVELTMLALALRTKRGRKYVARTAVVLLAAASFIYIGSVSTMLVAVSGA